MFERKFNYFINNFIDIFNLNKQEFVDIIHYFMIFKPA
jgi:hypothetical protein